MDGDEFGRLIYLVLLGAVIGGYFFISNRDRLGETARQAALWALIFAGTVVGVGLWGDLKDTLLPSQSVINGVITAPRGSDGHYHLTLQIGDVPVEFVVDTGATQIVINQADAKRIGIDTSKLIYGGRALTANGEVRTASITLNDVSVEGLAQGDLRATVNEGELDTSLLGMRFLERFNRVEISGDELILEQ
jgi:aspartyl protease family protein